MRVESFERDLKDGYRIVGFHGGMVDFPPRHCQPLEMAIFYDGRRVNSDEDWKRYVFPHVDSDMFHNHEFRGQSDFIQNWHGILMGKHGDWKLNVAEVTPVSVILDYEIPSSHCNHGFVWLTLPDTMRLEILGPKVFGGIEPRYSIDFHSKSKTAHIVEDMGHTIRDINLCIKNPSCPIDPICMKQPYTDNPYSDNQCAKITEYTCV